MPSIPPRDPAPEWSDAGEEDYMSDIVLSNKAAKLMKVCEAEGFDNLDDLLALSVVDKPRDVITRPRWSRTRRKGTARRAVATLSSRFSFLLPLCPLRAVLRPGFETPV
jgi:hypothetical protein